MLSWAPNLEKMLYDLNLKKTIICCFIVIFLIQNKFCLAIEDFGRNFEQILRNL